VSEQVLHYHDAPKGRHRAVPRLLLCRHRVRREADSPGEAAGRCAHGGRGVPPDSVPDGDAAADHVDEVRRLEDA
jgi:hypothetical protein